ncbi:MAG: TRAP transporter substrate-binding protein [Pikeienuella sp.]
MNKMLTAALLAIATGMTQSVAAETWDMPTPYGDATFHTANIREFARDVSERTGGALEITVHSAGSLFKHPEISRAVRGGQVPIGEFFMPLLTNDNPVFGVDSLPFLATNYEEAQKLWAAQKPVIEKLLDQQNMVALFSVAWPPQGIYTKVEINSIDDLKGLKFRTNSPTLEQFASLAGAAPTQVEVPDIPQAFSTGRVDAMLTSPTTGVDSQAWDFLSYYTDTRAWVPKNVVVVNKRAFRALDEATRNAVLEAAAAAEARGWEMSRAETAEKVATMAENGINVVQPSEALKASLQDIGAQMLESWLASAGEEGKAVIDAYRN